MEPSAGRTKRAAASKAEGFFRALAFSGASAAPGESVDDSEWKKSSKGSSADAPSPPPPSPPPPPPPPDCTAGSRGTSDSPPSDRKGTGSSVERSGPSTEANGGGRQGQQQTKRKSGGGRGANEKGKVKTTGDRPLKSAGRNSGGGGGSSSSSGSSSSGSSHPRGQPGMKPRPTATSASVVRVLGRLGEWGVKVPKPANPTVGDVWKAVDVVLRNLPDTSGLTVDALVGFARLRRSTRKGSPLPIGNGSCGGMTTGDAGESASRRRGGDENNGCYSDEAAAAKALVAAATAAECAKGRPVPPQKMVELKATAALQRLATTVEELRYDVNAPEEARWQAWAKETLREYAPLQEQMEQERQAALARISKKERIEKKLLKEEAIAVCYVCNGGEHFENRSDLQEIVFCERCCVAVHSSCYGFDAEEIHKPEKWYCDYCSHLISKAQERLDAALAAAASSSSSSSPSSSPPEKAMEGAKATPQGPPTAMVTSGSPANKAPAAKRRKVCGPQNPNPNPNQIPNHNENQHSEIQAQLVGAPLTPADRYSATGMSMTPNGHSASAAAAAGGEANARRLEADGAKERPVAAAVMPGGEGASGGDRSKSAGEAASTSNGPSLSSSTSSPSLLQTETTERSRSGLAGGAVGEKAVHPPSPAEQSTKIAAPAPATRGQEERSGPSPPAERAGAAREERHTAEGMTAAAEARCGIEAKNLKRDAQMATKRSWDDFENDAGTVVSKAAAPRPLPPPDGGLAHPAREGGAATNSGCSSGSDHAGPAKEPSSSSSSPQPPEPCSRCPSRDKHPPPPAACSSFDGRPRTALAGLPVTRRQEAVEPPEVKEARASLEEAQELMGVDLPSLDKGPEADCVLCHVPRGAFLRAERGSKLGWCHTLCAFSKGLVIEDRVVKTRGFIKGDGTSQCHFCRNKKSGGLITCSHPGCNVSFHPLCGRARGGTAVRGPHLHPRDWTATCPEHAAATPTCKGPMVASTGPSTGPMPVKEMYTTSKPPPPKKPASTWVKSGPKAVMCDADPVVAGFRSEIKQTYALTPEGLCPAGKCHQCKRRNRWRAMCSTCEDGICIYCICQQKESPRAVLAALIAHDDARRNGHPRPPNIFTCYKCRKICFCKDCGGAGARAAVLAAVARAGGAPATASQAKREPAPGFHHRKASSSQCRTGPVPLAPRPAEAGGKANLVPAPSQPTATNLPKLTKKRPGAAAGIAPASGSDKRPRKKPPGNTGGGNGTQQQQLLLQRQQQQQLQHVRQQHQHRSSALPTDSRYSSAGSAAAAAAAAHSDPLSAPNRYSSLESVLLSEEGTGSTSSVLFPWMDQPATPAVRSSGAPTDNAVSSGYGNSGGAWDAGFLSASRGGGRTGAGSEMRQLSGVVGGDGGGGGGSQANGGGFSNGARGDGGYSGQPQQHQQPSMAAAAAAAAVTAAAVAPGNWRSQGTASPLPVRSASAGMPAINVSVSMMSSTATTSNSSSSGGGGGGGGGLSQSAVSGAATVAASVGGVKTAKEAARAAHHYYLKAVAAREAARKLTEDVLDAKAFSDRNNKAAMWRVEAATKLKDKLIMANELINGYSELRRKAHNEAKVASAEETSAVARYEKAHKELARLQELATAARTLAATDSPSSWSNDSSSNSSTTSNVSSTGATTCSASTERSESPASALTAALAAGKNGVTGGYGGGHVGNPTPLAENHPASSSVGDASNQRPSSSFGSNSSPPSGERYPPTGVLTAMNKPVPVRAGDGGNSGTDDGNPFCTAAAAAAEKASRASAEVERLRRAAVAATAAVQQKEASVLELANRQKRAEAGRAELVRETQFASDSASKASQAAMHYEKVAQAKKQEEKAAFEHAHRSEWEAKTANEYARRLAEAERKVESSRQNSSDAFFGIDIGGGDGGGGGGGGGNGGDCGRGGGAVMPAAAAALARTNVTSDGGRFRDGGGGGSGGTVMPAAAAALAKTNITSSGGGLGDGGSGDGGGTAMPARAAALARTLVMSSNGFGDGGGGTVMPAAAAALARTNITSSSSGFGDGGGGGGGGKAMPAAAAALARTNITSSSGGFGDGGGGGTARPAAAALARTNITSSSGGFGDGGGGGGGGGTVMPAAAAALARTNITSNGRGFGDGGSGGGGGTVMSAAAAALSRTNITSNSGGFGDGGGGGTAMPAAALARTNITSSSGGFGGGGGGEDRRSDVVGTNFVWKGQNRGPSYPNNNGGSHQRRC
eukprot:g7559.t1